jgi:transcription antitermination factor NusB
MNSPRRRAREMALKALYQAEMVKSANDEALEQILSSALYQPVFEALAREFLKNTKIEQILSGEVEDFVLDFSDSLSAIPRVSPENLPEQIRAIIEKYFKGATGHQQSEKELTEFYRKVLNRRNKNLPVEEFARQLVARGSENHARIDQLIEKTAQNWSLERMAAIDRCILRIAICELFYFEEIPANATINEAIELAKKYSAERSYEFVNGILDRICKENNLSKIETPVAVKPKALDNDDVQNS